MTDTQELNLPTRRTDRYCLILNEKLKTKLDLDLKKTSIPMVARFSK